MTPIIILIWQSLTALSMIILSQSFEVEVISRIEAIKILKFILDI